MNAMVLVGERDYTLRLLRLVCMRYVRGDLFCTFLMSVCNDDDDDDVGLLACFNIRVRVYNMLVWLLLWFKLLSGLFQRVFHTQTYQPNTHTGVIII